MPVAAAFANRKLTQSRNFGRLNVDIRNPGGGGRLQREFAEKGIQIRFIAFNVDVDSAAFVQHPSSERIRMRQAKYQGPEAHALHDAAYVDGSSFCHSLTLPPTTQPRPCQPICTALPSSTRTGTVRCPPLASRIRFKASASTSTSYSSKSRPFHSSHSRMSRV